MKCVYFFFFKQKTAYEMRISDWSSDVCSSDLSAEEAVNMMETLAALEAEAAMLAARRMPPSERDALEQVHTARERAPRALDTTAYISSNKQFNETSSEGHANGYTGAPLRQPPLRISIPPNNRREPSRAQRSQA